jgi:protein TonB
MASARESAIDDVIRIDITHGVARTVTGIAAGIIITFMLYWLMSALVAAGRNALTEAPKGRIVDFVRVPNPPQLRTEQPKPEKPVKPEVAPETPQIQNDTVKPSGNTVNIGALSIDNNLAVDTSAGLSASDGEYLPIVKVAPMYPRRAQTRGIEGWVLLSFTVTEVGSVIDPVVIDAEPSGIFDNAASKAVLRFKYKPRVVNGKAQMVRGVEHLITFKLDK